MDTEGLMPPLESPQLCKFLLVQIVPEQLFATLAHFKSQS